MGPPVALILALKEKLRLDDFVETGTYRGDTAEWASEHFARVATVELSPEYYAAAVARFGAQPNVRVLQGDSGTRLRQLVAELQGPAVFWLDAHWSGLDTAGREAECPLIAELTILNDAPHEHSLLVDDARLFAAPPPRPHRAEKWPDLGAVLDALRAGGRRHVVMFEDVLIAVPVAARSFLTEWLQDEIALQRAASGSATWWKKLRQRIVGKDFPR